MCVEKFEMKLGFRANGHELLYQKACSESRPVGGKLDGGTCQRACSALSAALLTWAARSLTILVVYNVPVGTE